MKDKTISAFNYIDNYAIYGEEDFKIDENIVINLALKLIREKKFEEAMDILYQNITEMDKNGNILVYYLIFYSYARCNIVREDLEICNNKMQELYSSYQSYSFLWEKAKILLKLENYDQAKQLFELVITNHQPTKTFRNLIIDTRIEYNFLTPIFQKFQLNLLQYNNLMLDRTNDILNNKSFLGKIEQEITLDQEFLIINKIKKNLQEYENDKFNKPSYQGIYLNKTHQITLNILYIGNTKMRVFENPVKYYLKESILKRGHNYHELCLDELMGENPIDKNFYDKYDGKEIFDMIVNFQINMVFLDYNIREEDADSDNFVGIINKIQNILKIQVVRYVMDYINFGAKIPAKWFESVAMILALNINKFDENCYKYQDKIFHCPLFCLTNEYKNIVKTHNFSIIGSDTYQAQRNKFIFGINNFVKNGTKINLNYNNKIYNMNEYVANYQDSKITFNSGCRGFLQGQYFYISTFRINEAIVNKCLLLEEGTMSCEDIYVPFVHYIPVYNRNDVMIYAQFFLKHEEWREKIVNEAYNFWQENYSYNHIWSEIERRLGFL